MWPWTRAFASKPGPDDARPWMRPTKLLISRRDRRADVESVLVFGDVKSVPPAEANVNRLVRFAVDGRGIGATGYLKPYFSESCAEFPLMNPGLAARELISTESSNVATCGAPQV